MRRPWLLMLLVPSVVLAESSSGGSPASVDQELPKVLYIVPWKEIGGAPALPALDLGRGENLLVPLDRDAARRQLRHTAPQTSREDRDRAG